MDDYVKPAVETLKPYDLSASKLIKGFGLAGTIGALLVGFVLFLAIKLRLLSKLGYYLGSVGICFLALGTTLLFNTPLLIIGNCFILAGVVFVVGFERTRLYYDIFRDNLHDGRALAWAGFVIFVSGLLAELITKMPVINRLYKWVPWIKDIVEATDKELVTLTSDEEPEPVPWTTPGRLRSRGKKE